MAKINKRFFDTVLIVLVGLPASGKSTYAKEVIRDNEDAIWISSDNIRIENDYDISNENVFNKMWNRTKEGARNHKIIIYDATNLWSKKRKNLIDKFNKFCEKNKLSHTAECVVFLQPIEVLKERNAKRIGREVVPEEVIDRMLRQFQMPALFEGFWNIVISESSKGKELPFGEIAAMEQDNPHHTLSLGAHLMKAQDAAIAGDYSKVIIGASLYHDIGKYWTKEFDDNGVAHFYNHENVGAYMLALHFLKHGVLIRRPYYRMVLIVNYHMRPYAWNKNGKTNDKLITKDKRRFQSLFLYLKILNDCDREAH